VIGIRASQQQAAAARADWDAGKIRRRVRLGSGTGHWFRSTILGFVAVVAVASVVPVSPLVSMARRVST
jgi:hypothetical protein